MSLWGLGLVLCAVWERRVEDVQDGWSEVWLAEYQARVCVLARGRRTGGVVVCEGDAGEAACADCIDSVASSVAALVCGEIMVVVV